MEDYNSITLDGQSHNMASMLQVCTRNSPCAARQRWERLLETTGLVTRRLLSTSWSVLARGEHVMAPRKDEEAWHLCRFIPIGFKVSNHPQLGRFPAEKANFPCQLWCSLYNHSAVSGSRTQAECAKNSTRQTLLQRPPQGQFAFPHNGPAAHVVTCW